MVTENKIYNINFLFFLSPVINEHKEMFNRHYDAFN